MSESTGISNQRQQSGILSKSELPHPEKISSSQEKCPASASPSAAKKLGMPRGDNTIKLLHKPARPPRKLQSVRRLPGSRTASPASPAGKNIFDFPDGDDAPPATDKAATPQREMKALRQRSELKGSSSPTSAAERHTSDIFGEKYASPPKPKTIQRSNPKIVAIGNGDAKTLEGLKAEVEVRTGKKVKFSPGHEPVLKPLTLNNENGLPKRRLLVSGSNRRRTSPRPGNLKGAAGKPVPAKNSMPQINPQKPSPTLQEICIASSPQIDMDMMDVDPEGTPISPNKLKMWKEPLESAEVTETEHSERSNDNRRSQGPGNTATTEIQKHPLRPSPRSQHLPNSFPKRRLIDSLVEQAQETLRDELEEDISDAEPVTSPSAESPESQSLVPEPLNSLAMLSDSQGSQSQATGPKFTYGRQRSMLAEQDFMQQLALEMPAQPTQLANGRKNCRDLVPALKPLASLHHEEDGDEASVSAIRSVHELRQAGANSRFLDEIQDFLERIGTPTATKLSMRRSGLLDLASKMKDKTFARQVRGNGVEQRLFVHLGQETDTVAGFILVSLLISVLIDGGMPHIVAQLRRQGITRLLIRLLECQSSISAVAKDRTSNMSKVAQSMVTEHHDDCLLMPIWEGIKPQSISPRTAALKCLEMMVRQTREAGIWGDIFSKELTTKLFAIVKSASNDGAWDLSEGPRAIDFHLALSALESHSIMARTVHDESVWISDYLPIIADMLEISSARPVDTFGDLQLLILRLTLNVTNNNPKASDVFARPTLMAAMGHTLVARFSQISRFLTEDDFSVVVDHLILVLGVMINFAEWSLAARESLQSLQGSSNDPLDGMVQAFLDNQERTSEVRKQSFFSGRLFTNYVLG